MYDYKQIEDSLQICKRKLYLSSEESYNCK